MFHAVIMLLAGLMAGMPYGKAINRNINQRLIDAWRVAHAALPIGAILLLVISAYGFMAALLLGPIVGYRGLSSKGPFVAKIVYSGNILGAITSFIGTVILLYAVWLNL